MDLIQKAKELFPDTPDEELNAGLTKLKEAQPGATDDQILQTAAQAKAAKTAAPPVDQRQQLVAATNQAGSPIAGALAGFGAGLQGGDVTSTFDRVNNAQRNEAKNRLAAFDENQAYTQSQDKLARENDPNSMESKTAQSLAISLGMKPDQAKNLTASKFKDFSPALQKRYEIEQNKIDRGERAQDRKDLMAMRQEDRDRARDDRLEREAKLSDKQVEGINQFDSTIGNAQAALDLLGVKTDPKTGKQTGGRSDWTGQIDARIPDALVGADQVNFRAAVGRMTDAYRHLITGAGAGNQELARLEGRLPQPTDTFNDFKSKAQGFINELKKAKGTTLQNFAKSGKNVRDFLGDDEALASTTPPSGKDDLVSVMQDGKLKKVPRSSLPQQTARK